MLKKILFNKTLWWRTSRYKFIKKKPEQRKKRKGSKKLKFRAKMLVRKNYIWRMASPLTTYISSFLKSYNYRSTKRRSFKEYILTKNFNHPLQIRKSFPYMNKIIS